MAFHAIPNVARLTIRISGPQLQVMTVGTYWRLASPAPMSALEVKTLADHGDIAMASEGVIAGGVNASCDYLGCEARALDTSSSPTHFSNANAAPGGVTGTLLPLETCLVCSLQTGEAGRSNRNRFYWPGIDTGGLDTSPKDGLFSAALIAAYHTTFSAFFGAVGGTDYVQVVASPKLGTYVDLVSFTFKRRPGSQRRREP